MEYLERRRLQRNLLVGSGLVAGLLLCLVVAAALVMVVIVWWGNVGGESARLAPAVALAVAAIPVGVPLLIRRGRRAQHFGTGMLLALPLFIVLGPATLPLAASLGGYVFWL